MSSPDFGWKTPGMQRMLAVACLGISACGVGERAQSPPVLEAGVSVDDIWLVADTDCPDPLVRYADADGDGEGDANVEIETCSEVPGFVESANDCDDLRSDVLPGATETCEDGLDNDCLGGDAECVPPDLATDALAYSREATDDEFGFVVLGGVNHLGGAVLFGAPNGELIGGSDDQAGTIHQLSGFMDDARGDRLSFSTRETGKLTGVAGSRVGRGLALGHDPSRVFVGTAGPISTATGDFTGIVAWYDGGLPVDGSLLEDASGYIGCGRSTGSSSYNGVDALAVGFWDDLSEEVLAMPLSLEGYMLVVSDPEGVSGDSGHSSGTVVNMPVGKSYGTALVWADIDGDGLDDLVITDPGRSDAASLGGGFDILPGSELRAAEGLGAEVRTEDLGMGVVMEVADQHVGTQVTTVDLDGDGVLEVAISNFNEDTVQPAAVYLVEISDMDAFAGDRIEMSALPSSTTYTRLVSEQQRDLFGLAMTSLGDGLAVGAAGWDPGDDIDKNDGAVYTFGPDPSWFASTEHTALSAAAALIETDEGGEGFGTGLSDAGDLDGDGHSDLWVGSAGWDAASARAVLVFNTGL